MPIPTRIPRYLDDPDRMAAFLGGVTESALYQGGQRRQAMSEVENKRRWELLRRERETVQEHQLEERKRQEAFLREKFNWQQDAPNRQLESQKGLEIWRQEQELEQQKLQWQRQAEAMEELDNFRRDLVKKGMPADRVERAVQIKRTRLGLPQPTAAPVQKAPVTKTIIGPDKLPHVMAFDPSIGGFTQDVGVAGSAYERPEMTSPETPKTIDVQRYMNIAQDGLWEALGRANFVLEDGSIKKPESPEEENEFLEAVWPIIQSYHQIDPKLAETAVVVAEQYLSPKNQKELRRVYDNVLRSTEQEPTGATAQPAVEPQAQGAPQMGNINPAAGPLAEVTDPTVAALTNAMRANVPQPAAPSPQAALEKLREQARKGDKTAQKILKANGKTWQ